MRSIPSVKKGISCCTDPRGAVRLPAEPYSLMQIDTGEAEKARRALACFRRHSSLFLYSLPHSSMASRMGRMDSPRGDRAYSTLGGISG